MMRKRLSLCDLMDCYNHLDNSWRFRDITKEEKRAEWAEHMLKLYPDLKPCPFCGGHPEFTPTYTSKSYFSCHGAIIECFNCDLKFSAEYESESLIASWNSELKR